MTAEDPDLPAAAPLFAVEGDTYIPAPFTRSPWSPDMLHGGAPAALLVGAIEAHDAERPWQMTRFTVDLFRPVPVTPLRVAVRTVRPGRKVSVAEAELTADDTVCARMSALLIRDEDVPVPDFPKPGDREPPRSPGDSDRASIDWPFVAFHTHGCEVRYARGEWLVPGPAFVWIRLLHPVLEGRLPSPMQRVAAAADSGNGVSSVLPFDEWMFVNPDLSVNVFRQPHGEWIGLDAATQVGDRGAGSAFATVYDELGRTGSSAQSLLVEPRG